MNKGTIVFFLGSLIAIFVWFCLRQGYVGQWPEFQGITLAVVQTASHPALDAVRIGFEKTIEYALKKSVRFEEYNIQGSVAQAQIIAQQLHQRADIDGILAIGTLAAQVLSQQEQEKPICFAAVTDPQAAGIVGPNICGASDAVSSEHVRALVGQLLPKVKKVGLLFNVSEKNASIMAERLLKELENSNYLVVSCAVTSEAELPAAMVHACQQEVIIAPIDNMVASTASFIAQKALEAQVPFIVSDIALVEKGALAGVGVDYHQVGVDAAQCMISVFNDQVQPDSIALVYPVNVQCAINRSVANQLSCQWQHMNTIKQV